MTSEVVRTKWMPLCKAADPVPRHGCALEVDGEPIALFMVDGRRYATSNVCTHQFALMTEGYVDGEYVECPMHQGRFHIPSGAAQGFPVVTALQTYPLRIEGDDVLIEVPLTDKP